MEYDVAVVGSGPAGVEAALNVARGGQRTVLISGTPVGGRATVGSLLPSKVWLHHANHHGRTDSSEIPGIAADVRATITGRVSWTRAALEAESIEIVEGEAKLVDRHHLQVGTRGIESEYVVLAVGSEPIFLPDVKPDGRRLIAPRHTKNLEELPESLVMIGGGVTGVEYASAFARMGTAVTLLSYDPLLPRSDREYVGRLEDTVRSLGIALETGVAVECAENTGDGVVVTDDSGRTHEAAYAFIATGRNGDLTILDTSAVELDRTPDGGFIATDGGGRTSHEGIFACGDVVGPPLTANTALYQARRVAETILTGRHSGEKPPALIEAVYTEPQLAHVGPVHELAERSDTTVVRKSYAASMLSHVHGGPAGEVKFWIDGNDDILGAAAFGESAAELLAPVQLAMEHGIPFSETIAVPFAYPTISEVVTD